MNSDPLPVHEITKWGERRRERGRGGGEEGMGLEEKGKKESERETENCLVRQVLLWGLLTAWQNHLLGEKLIIRLRRARAWNRNTPRGLWDGSEGPRRWWDPQETEPSTLNEEGVIWGWPPLGLVTCLPLPDLCQRNSRQYRLPQAAGLAALIIMSSHHDGLRLFETVSPIFTSSRELRLSGRSLHRWWRELSTNRHWQ